MTTDYPQMILELRNAGISAKAIARFGRKKGREFTHYAIVGILQHGRRHVRDDIAMTIKELYEIIL